MQYLSVLTWIEQIRKKKENRSKQEYENRNKNRKHRKNSNIFFKEMIDVRLVVEWFIV